MKRPLKFALVTFLAHVAGFALILALVWVFVDLETLRPTLEQSLSQAMGRKVTVGELGLAPGLGVRVRAADLEIGAPLDPDVEPGPTLQADDVRIKVALFPVLRGEVDVRSLRFRDGVVKIEDQVLFSRAALKSRVRRDAEGRVTFRGNLSGRADLFGNARTDLDFDALLEGDILKILALEAEIGPGTLGASGSVSGIEKGEYSAELEVNGRFGRTTANGTLGGQFLEDATRITFCIDSPFVDLDELAEMAGWTEESAAEVSRLSPGGIFPAALAAEGESPAPQPPAVIVASGTLRAERASFLGLELDSMVARLRYEDERLVFEEAGFGLYGGTHAGIFRMEVMEPDLPFTLEDALEEVDIDPLIAAFSPDLAGTLQGRAFVNLDVEGKAGDASPDGTVRGDGDFRVTDGTIRGVGLLGLISEKLAGTGIAGDEGDTPFERLSAGFRVRDRALETSNLEFRSPDLDLDGKGRITFDGALDLDLTASFSPAVSDSLVSRVPKLDFRVGGDGRLTLPLRIDGNVASPGVSIDLDKVLEQGLKRKLKDRLDGWLKKRK